MPIRDKTGQGDSVTETSRAMRLFTDRHDAIKHFAALLNDDLAADRPTPEKVLFFHGDGGNGKSLLLRFLRERCCKRLPDTDWERLRTKDGEDFVAFLKEIAANVMPSAAIDFGSGPALAEGSIQDAPVALLQLRRDLVEQDFRFPIFDFACIWYLHKARNLSGEQIKSYFPAQDLASSLVDAFTGTSWGSVTKAAIGLFGKNLDKSYTLFSHKRKLEPERLAYIQSLDPRTELIDHLPEFFAADLNTAMRTKGAPKRVALFFDTHEAFWGARDRELANDRFFYRDEWLRCLLTALDLTSGIVVVGAGREAPLWKRASRFRVPEAYLMLWPVKHFTRPDAAIYLERAKVTDAAMQQALIDYASVAVDEVHPLYLGMCVDIVRAARAANTPVGPEEFQDVPQMEMKQAELLDRLLRYVDQNIGYAVRALSACRAFNLEIYLRLGRELNFAADAPSFEILRSFSFVWESRERREGWHRIHDLVRRLGRDNEDDLVRRADTVMERHYRELAQAGDDQAIAEAIYHANQLDWERGVDEWESVFDAALQMSRYKLCDALLDVRSEMSIESDFNLGGVSQSEGDYFLTLARYENARREYLEAIAAYDKALTLAPNDVDMHNNKGNALRSLGDLQLAISQHDGAMQSYVVSIAIYDKALALAPDYVNAHNNKGLALQGLGDLQTAMSQHGKAMQSYANSIAAYDKALTLVPDDTVTHNNKGLAFASLGELQAMLSQHDEAKQSYAEAIAAYDKAFAPDDVAVNSNKALALQGLGDLQAKLSQHDEARQSYANSIAVYDKALALAPDDIVVHNNKGVALQSLGELQAILSQHDEARQSYTEAITAYDNALTLAADDVVVHNSKGNALRGLGELQAMLSQHDEARQSYANSIAVYDKALALAPDDVVAHNNKGYAFTSLGELQVKLSQHDEAKQSYTEAITACDNALTLAADDVVVYNNKGYAVLSLGELQVKLSQHDEAKQSYTEAVAAFDKALTLAPDDVAAHINKGYALQKLGELQAMLSQHDEARQSYTEAVAAFDKALVLAPDDVIMDCSKGDMLLSLGELQAKLSQHDEAKQSYTEAVAAFDKALTLAPDYVDAHNSKGNALRGLGELQAKLSQHDEAVKSWQVALAEASRVLEIAPNDKDAKALMDMIQRRLAG